MPPSATGTYRYTVSAQDLAGNAQRGATPAKVVVKGPWWHTIGHSVQRRAIVVARFGTGGRRLLVVGGVHAVEIADGEGAGAEIGGHLVEAAIEAHGSYSTTISSPSYARRMCGGSMLSARSWPRSWQI